MIVNRTVRDVWWSFWPAASKRQRDGREVSSSLWFVLDRFFSFIWCEWSDHHEHLLPRYGLGIVAEEYVEGQMIDIEVELTAYHQVGCKTSKRVNVNVPIKRYNTIWGNVLAGLFWIPPLPPQHSTTTCPTGKEWTKSKPQRNKHSQRQTRKQDQCVNRPQTYKQTNFVLQLSFWWCYQRVSVQSSF